MAYALAKPGAWTDSPWGEDHDVAKVGSKIFCFPGPGTILVKNAPDKVEEFKARYPDATGPAPYLDKRLWLKVLLDGVPDQDIEELIDDSYDLVVAKLPVRERP